ncbi:glycosyltransferase [Acinetobacter sp. BSP-28]|uniref:glycosyltransferase n=1 Tax=Acinetobacter sp. BSP-28 TaxID=3344661 RepID=UPI00376FD26B
MSYLVLINFPMYSVEKFADSLFLKTYKNIEYLLIDGCSPDQPVDIGRKIVSKYNLSYPQFRIIRHELNKNKIDYFETIFISLTGIWKNK